MGSEPPKFHGSPNIFFNQISAASFFMFTFCWENRLLIGRSTKIFSVKTGFEKLKKKADKLDGWYFGLLAAIYQKVKDENMRWTSKIQNISMPFL